MSFELHITNIATTILNITNINHFHENIIDNNKLYLTDLVQKTFLSKSSLILRATW